MAKKVYRQLTVSSTDTITPHMQRIVLTGEALADFPQNFEGGYIKFLFSADSKIIESSSELESLAPQKPIMRTYTIRAFNPHTRLLTVDFVLHMDSDGPASKWAQIAQPGDEIIISGPGPVKLVNPKAPWCLLAGDMTALPAISCNLEILPEDAKGYAIIEVESETDIQPLSAPAGVDIKWVVSDHDSTATKFLEAIYSVTWLAGEPYIWCACEFSAMRTLRKYFKNERQINKQSMYISSYWKAGFSDEQHKLAKQKDAQLEG